MDAVFGIAVTIVLGLVALAAVIFLGGALVSAWSATRSGPRASGPAIITRGHDVYTRVDPVTVSDQSRSADTYGDEIEDLSYLDDLPPEPPR